MACWVAHADKVLPFAGETIDIYEVCRRFKLDKSSEISVCGETVEKGEDGTWAVSVAALRAIEAPGQDGNTRATAFRVVASLIIYIRRGTNCKKFEVDGSIDLRSVCRVFRLDLDAGIELAGFGYAPSSDGASVTCLPTRIATVTQDGKSAASAFVIDGTSIKGESPRIAKRFKSAYFVSQPSSETKDLKHFTKCIQRKYFNDMRAGRGIPIGIAARPFGNFVDNLKRSHEFKIQDLIFAEDLISKMTRVYDKESDRRLAFVGVLRTYLGDSFTVLDNQEAVEVKRFTKKEGTSSHHLKTPGIQVINNGVVVKVCTIVVKPEMGMNGEGLTESLFYYTVDAAHNHVRDRYTGSPQLMIEVVGPNIRVGAVVYQDKATYEPLTDFLSLLPLTRADHVYKVATLGIALRKALHELTALYGAAAVVEAHEDEPERDPTYWPYPIKERYPAGSTVRRSREGREVFYVNGTRVVKLVQRYGVAAHRQWEALGFAPRHTIDQLPGGWMMIDMECLLPSQGWQLLFDLRQRFLSKRNRQGWEKIKETAINALKLLQEQQPLMVHGDLRLNNVMYNEKTKKVCFLDFDWAGETGTVRYPSKLNAVISWPEGVVPNAIIRPTHDMELLKAELTLPEDDQLFPRPPPLSSGDISE